jgi:UDP-hydrolysing UDP-N-acetyl-D-glucosamine 2-epimerase
LHNRRKIAVFTSGRQDYGILRSTLFLLRADPSVALQLIVGGMHLSAKYGKTASYIEDDGFTNAEKLDWLGEGQEPSITEQAARALVQCGAVLERQKPDCLVLLGDRYETASAAMAATLCRIPLTHIHGGEETEGAFDNSLRHAITKLSHLHFVSHPNHAARVIQMGEDPASVHVVGAPGLDNLFRDDLPGRAEIEKHFERPLRHPLVIVTVHPTTLAEDPLAEINAVEDAIGTIPATYVITLPNSDPGSCAIRERLQKIAARQPGAIMAEALGDRLYTGLMKIADAMLGNSSSGLIEAQGCGLPVVNVGDRQKGRLAGINVISVAGDGAQTAEALKRALTPEFRVGAQRDLPICCDGNAGKRIVSILRDWNFSIPPRKVFYPQLTRSVAACEKN